MLETISSPPVMPPPPLPKEMSFPLPRCMITNDVPLSVTKITATTTTLNRNRCSTTKELRFGNYLLGQTLGEGEFGKVKLGWLRPGAQRQTKNIETGQVAVKLIRKESVTEKARMNKIDREIYILQKMNHPNIVKLFDVIYSERYIGIILEYASGGELFHFIISQRYLKDPVASKLFSQLISGVLYLHNNGVVHRDIKLENLLLDRGHNIVITDFGFAKEFGGKLLPKGHSTNFNDFMKTSCGSPCYAAPELVVDDIPYHGRKVDVWSCGVVLYAMLAGYLPFDDDPHNPEGSNINLLYQYITTTPLTFPEYITPIPRDLLRHMLVPNPDRRYTLEQVAQHTWLRPYRASFSLSTNNLDSTSGSHLMLRQGMDRLSIGRSPATQNQYENQSRRFSYYEARRKSETFADSTKGDKIDHSRVFSLPHNSMTNGYGSPKSPTSDAKPLIKDQNQSLSLQTHNLHSVSNKQNRSSLATVCETPAWSSNYKEPSTYRKSKANTNRLPVPSRPRPTSYQPGFSTDIGLENTEILPAKLLNGTDQRISVSNSAPFIKRDTSVDVSKTNKSSSMKEDSQNDVSSYKNNYKERSYTAAPVALAPANKTQARTSKRNSTAAITGLPEKIFSKIWNSSSTNIKEESKVSFKKMPLEASNPSSRIASNTKTSKPRPHSLYADINSRSYIPVLSSTDPHRRKPGNEPGNVNELGVRKAPENSYQSGSFNTARRFMGVLVNFGRSAGSTHK